MFNIPTIVLLVTTMPSQDTRPSFHNGERAVQTRAGVRNQARSVASMIDSKIPKPVHGFLSAQPFVVTATADPEGQVWASLLTDEPGFIEPVDSEMLHLDTQPQPGDPLAKHLRTEMFMGLLVIDPRNRSRFRINGVANPTANSGIELRAQEVYPNCHQYIQQRTLEHVVDSDPNDVRNSERLSSTQREWIGEADTFFIASLHPEHGADASHRGGDPGFIEVRSDKLVFPDYPGNKLFNTLGNIAINRNVGLLFVDFESGTILQLTGHADIIWDEDRIHEHDGAERLVEFTVTGTIEIPHGNPLRWQLTERSPSNP